MLKKLFRKALKPLLGKKAATVASEALDDVVVGVADAATGGLASKVDDRVGKIL